jgi:hypothetical protein
MFLIRDNVVLVCVFWYTGIQSHILAEYNVAREYLLK